MGTHRLRTKSDCAPYHFSKVSAPLAGVQEDPEGKSPEQRASFINSQAKIFGELLYRSTIVRTYDSVIEFMVSSWFYA